MNTTELIEIARECGAHITYIQGSGKQTAEFFMDELQQFAKRIEQPLLERIDSAAKVANAVWENLNAKDARIAELELALQKQAKSALMGVDAAKANGAAMLKVATEIHNQQKPELLDSERQANSVLTEENEKLQQQIEQLREALQEGWTLLGESDEDGRTVVTEHKIMGQYVYTRSTYKATEQTK